MHCHYPKELPDLEVYYNITAPGQEQTNDQPGIDPAIEWEDIEIGGFPISDELHHHFISQFGKRWEKEIIDGLKARSQSRRRIAA